MHKSGVAIIIKVPHKVAISETVKTYNFSGGST